MGRSVICALLALTVCGPLYSTLACDPRIFAFFQNGLAPRQLIREYADWSVIGTQQNKQFIELVRKKTPLLYFRTENVILKELNDRIIGDKALVTALDNLYKDLFWRQVQRDPRLAQKSLAQYSDFKSLSLAFPQGDPQIQGALADAHRLVAEQFRAILGQPSYRSLLRNAQGLSSDPGKWHLSGVGNSFEQSALAARHGRQLGHWDEVAMQTFLSLQRSLKKQLEELYKQYDRLEKTLGAPFFVKWNGASTLDENLIEGFLKLQATDLDDYVVKAQTFVLEEYGREISRSHVLEIQKILDMTDLYSPALLQERRVQIPYAEAQFGSLSIDFRGQNARNRQALIASLNQSRKKSIAEVLQNNRDSEKITSFLLDDMRNSVDQIIGHSQVPARRWLSGDDGWALPEKAWSRDVRETLYRRLARAHPRERIVWVEPTPSDRNMPRTQIHVQGENFEKALRKVLRAHTAAMPNQASDRILKDVPMAIEINPAQGRWEILILRDHAVPALDLQRFRSWIIALAQEQRLSGQSFVVRDLGSGQTVP